MAFSSDGNILAFGSQDGTITLWHMPSRTLIRKLSGRGRAATGLAFVPDGHTLVSISGPEICFWRVSDGCRMSTYTEGVAVSCVSVSPTGEVLAYGRDDATIVLAQCPLGEESGMS